MINRDEYAYNTIENFVEMARKQQRFTQRSDMLSKLHGFFKQEKYTAMFPVSYDNTRGSFSIINSAGENSSYEIAFRNKEKRLLWRLNISKKTQTHPDVKWDLIIKGSSRFNYNRLNIRLSGSDKLYEALLRVDALQLLNKTIKCMDPDQPLVVSKKIVRREMIDVLNQLYEHKCHHIEKVEPKNYEYRKSIGGKLNRIDITGIDIQWSHIYQLPECKHAYSINVKKDGVSLWSLQTSTEVEEPFMSLYKNGEPVKVPSDTFEELFVALRGDEVIQALRKHCDQKIKNRS